MKMNAFTLAEILITLAVIGVIAALTLQPLTKKYKKLETVTKLKKAYTTINEALRLSETDNGDYQTWESGIDLGPEEYLKKYWLPYFNVYKLCTTFSECGYTSNFPWTLMDGSRLNYNFSLSSRRIPFIATDGILYQISVAVGNTDNVSVNQTNINIDINGSKGPNIVGKDYFMFTRTDTNGIMPLGYNITKKSTINSNCSKSGNCHYCAEKIRRAGWKISDDYPW